METLDIEIDNYLYHRGPSGGSCGGLRYRAHPAGQLHDAEALGALQLNIPGVQTVSLTPQMLADVLAAGAATPDMQALLRAEGILPFCASAATRWQTQYRMPCARFWRRAPPT
ncbi:MAG: hypothetical protein ACLRZH_13735 [Ruthenibacterium lactatiformans]